MTMQTGQVAPVNGSTPLPQADPDAAKYDELRKELGIEAEAAEPEPQAEPAQQEPGQQQEPAKGKPEHVPYSEHENLQRALKEAREQSKTAEARFAQALEALTRRAQPEPEPKKTEAPKIPDKLEDPIGHFEGKIAQLEAQLQQAAQGSQMTAEQLQTYQQQQQFHAVVVRAEEEINDPKSANHKADYWDAVGHLETQRVKELEHMYPDASPYAAQVAQQYGLRSVAELRTAVLNHDRQAVAVQALQMGMSPAEFYYNLALNRGYQPKAAQRAPNGQFVPADKGKQQIEAAKRGKAASVSISGGDGGRKGAEDMSLTDLADLAIENPAEFDKVWEQMARQGKLG